MGRREGREEAMEQRAASTTWPPEKTLFKPPASWK